MMAPKLLLRTLVFFCWISFLNSTPAFSVDEHQHAENEQAPTKADARPQIIKISSNGVAPTKLTMQKSDSVVFFYNTTDEDLLTLEIDFGARSVHCSGALRVVKEPGLSRTRKPFGPKEFVSTCFHEKGAYPYKIFSSRSNNQVFSGSVSVE